MDPPSTRHRGCSTFSCAFSLPWIFRCFLTVAILLATPRRSLAGRLALVRSFLLPPPVLTSKKCWRTSFPQGDTPPSVTPPTKFFPLPTFTRKQLKCPTAPRSSFLPLLHECLSLRFPSHVDAIPRDEDYYLQSVSISYV